MIQGHTKTKSLFDMLHAIDDTLYPTGSRFFGNWNASSDFDYFAKYSRTLADVLVGLGFSSVTGQEYKDSNTIAVYRAFDRYATGQQIDIQLVDNTLLKQAVQDVFKKAGILRPTQEQWNTAFLVNVPAVTSPARTFALSPDNHHFSSRINAIKYLREYFYVRGGGSFEHPGLSEAMKFVDGVLHMAFRGDK